MKFYNENNASDSFDEVIDLDTGEKVGKEQPNLQLAYRALLQWAEERRRAPFVNVVKQFTAMKKMRKANISLADVKKRWKELENEPLYQKIGLDFMSVLNSFDRKPSKNE